MYTLLTQCLCVHEYIRSRHVCLTFPETMSKFIQLYFELVLKSLIANIIYLNFFPVSFFLFIVKTDITTLQFRLHVLLDTIYKNMNKTKMEYYNVLKPIHI